MDVNSTFNANYYLELGNDLQGGSVVFRYSGGSNQAGADGVIVDVFDDEGRSWTGVFSFGSHSPKGVTGVYHLPELNRFCVVSK